MPCRTVKLDNGSVAIVKTSRPEQRRCSVPGCQKSARILCDYPIVVPARRPGDKDVHKTCDKPLCAIHAVRADLNVDFCPDHTKDP